MNNSFIARMYAEEKDLRERIDKLAAFKESIQWNEITDEEKKLMTEQLRYMREYMFTLGKLISLYEE